MIKTPVKLLIILVLFAWFSNVVAAPAPPPQEPTPPPVVTPQPTPPPVVTPQPTPPPVVVVPEPTNSVNIEDPDYVSLRMEMLTVQHVREGQNYTSNGLTSRHNQFYSFRTTIEIANESDQSVYAKLVRNIWVTLGVNQIQHEAFEQCRAKSFDALKNKVSFTLVANGIPFTALYNSPVDWNEMRQINQNAKAVEQSARKQLKIEEVNHKDILNQIHTAQQALASAVDSKKKNHIKNQIANLEKKAQSIWSRAQANFANAMSKVAKLKERSQNLAKKISEELLDMQTRIEKNTNQVASINARISKATEPMVIEKLKIQLLMAQDRLDKNQAELLLMRPGLKHHISLNASKYTVQCN